MRPAESATELRRGCDRVATGELQQRAGSCDGVVTVDDRGEKRGGEVLWCGGLVGYTAGMEASKESGSRRKGEGDLYEIFDRKRLRKDCRLDSKNEGEKGDSCRGVCVCAYGSGGSWNVPGSLGLMLREMCGIPASIRRIEIRISACWICFAEACSAVCVCVSTVRYLYRALGLSDTIWQHTEHPEYVL